MATGGGTQRRSINTKLDSNDLFDICESLYKARDKYKFIGLGIGVEISTIDAIVKKRDDPDECLLEILSVRLRKTPALTWADIIKTLKSRLVGEHRVAEEIEKSLENESNFEKYKNEAGKGEGGRGSSGGITKSTENEVKNENEEKEVGGVKGSGGEEAKPSKAGCTEESKKSSDKELSHDNDSIQLHYDSSSISKAKDRREGNSASASRGTTLQEQYIAETPNKAMNDSKIPGNSMHDGTKHRRSTPSEQSHAELSKGIETASTNEETRSGFKQVVNTEGDFPDGRKKKGEGGEKLGRKRVWREQKEDIRGLKYQRLLMEAGKERGGKEKTDEYKRKRLNEEREINESMKSKSARYSVSPHPTTDNLQSENVQIKGNYPESSKPKGKQLVTSESKKCVSDQSDSKDEIDSDNNEEEMVYSKVSGLRKPTSNSYSEPASSDEEVKEKPGSVVELQQKKRDRAPEVSEVDEDVPGDDEESDPDVRDQVAKKQIRRRQKDSPAMKGDSSPSSSQDDKDTQEEWKESGASGGVRRERKMREEEKNTSSSLDSDDSSPENEVVKNLTEKEKQKLVKEFKYLFGRLCITINDPVETAVQLQEKRLISFSFLEGMLRSPESRQEKNISLVRELYKKLKLHPDRLFTIIKIFLSREVNAGNKLWIQAGKVCPEVTATLLGCDKPFQHTLIKSDSLLKHEHVRANNTELLPPQQPVSSLSTISSVPSHSQVSQSTTQSGSSPVLTEYAEYLKACYRARPLAAADKYLPTLSSPYINLAMVSRKDSGPQERDEFTRQTLHGGIDQIVRYKIPIAMEDLLSPEKTGGRPVRFVLVEGPPGIGKSTSMWELCRRWDEILGGYVIVLLLKLREKYVLNATSLSALFRYENNPQVNDTIARELAATHGKNLLLILDGFDEVSHSFHKKSVVKSILCRRLLPECTIILTTRPSAKHTLESACQPRIDKHVEIIGFTEEERVRFIIEVFCSEPELQANFLKYMFLVPHIKSMMYIPLNCAIIAQVYYESQKSCHLTIPKTRTQLYAALTHSLLVRHMKMKDKEQEYTCMLPEGLGGKDMEEFKCLAKFAFDSYHSKEEKKVTFFKEDIPEGLVNFGFMNESHDIYAGKGVEKTLSFLHLSLQEYLAAWHLASSYSTKFHVLYCRKAIDYKFIADYKVIDKEERNVLQLVRDGEVEPAIFLAGITGMICQSENDSNLWEEYITICARKKRYLLCSMYEAQNQTLPSHYFAIKERRVVQIKSDLTPYDCYALSYCLAHSSNSIRLQIGIMEHNRVTLLETFLKGIEDHCKSTSLNVENIIIKFPTAFYEVSNKCISWLTNPKLLYEVLELEIYDQCCNSSAVDGSILHNFLQSFGKLEALNLHLYDSTLLGFLSAIKSELKTLNIAIVKVYNPKQHHLVHLVEQHKFNLKNISLNIRLPFSYYDISSLTDALLHSILKSVLTSNQITQLLLPNISRETMAGVRSILVHCRSLVSLKLVRTRLGYDGILFICSALRKNTTLKSISINDLELSRIKAKWGTLSHLSVIKTLSLPDKNTCTSFLLEINNILKKNTTLPEMNIQSGYFQPLYYNDSQVQSQWTGLGPLEQFNLGAVASRRSPNLRRSFSSSDLTQPQTLLLWLRNYEIRYKRKLCSLPSFTAPDTQVLQSFSDVDPRLRECLKISSLELYVKYLKQTYEAVMSSHN